MAERIPDPPPARILARLPPSYKPLSAGSELWRIYPRSGRHPITWEAFRDTGPLGHRFDHHQPLTESRNRTILYAALDGPTCLSEVFQDTRLIDRTRNTPWLVAFALQRDVTLLDLTSIWITRAGTSLAISSGSRAQAQKWSRAIYEAYPDVEGLFYSSSMNAGAPAVALYERATDAMPAVPLFHRALADPHLDSVIRNAASYLGYGVA
jgi:hypothetical protein